MSEKDPTMSEKDPNELANAILAGIESEKHRPVRSKKLPLKLMDTAIPLSEAFNDEQLSSKYLYFNESLHNVFLCMHEFVLIRAYL